MTHKDQTPFAAAEFADNPEPRVPCVLILDTSASMRGGPLDQLNAGLRTLKDELVADSLAAKRAEIAVVTFGPVTVINDFMTADEWQPPTLECTGDTPLGAAVQRSLDLIGVRKAAYRQAGQSYYRPWAFLITDGAPTDDWQGAAQRVRQAEAERGLSFFAVGVDGADMGILAQVALRTPLSLKGLQFREMFSWLSNSMSAVSRSAPGQSVPLPNPAGPDGWAAV